MANKLDDTDGVKVSHGKPLQTPVTNGIPKMRDEFGKRQPDSFFAVGASRDISKQIDKAARKRS